MSTSKQRALCARPNRGAPERIRTIAGAIPESRPTLTHTTARLLDVHRNGAIGVAVDLTACVGRLHLIVQRDAVVGAEVALFTEIRVRDAVAAHARILASDAATVRCGRGRSVLMSEVALLGTCGRGLDDGVTAKRP